MGGIIVIGGGQAGCSLVAKLRAEGHTGPITLLCEEAVPPYQRPPLSKKYLLGDMPKERLYLRPGSWYAEQDITLRLGAKVEAIDAAARTVTVAGEALTYDQLALTTGARPHRLPAAIGGDLSGVYGVRTLADVDAMAHEFAPGKRVLIVGGGYIGLEAAAVAAARGMEVTLVEMADRILKRVAAPVTSDFFRALHLAHGVTLREATGLERLIGDGHVSGAVLAGGDTLDVDLVVVGVGIAPNVALAEAAGLRIDNGIATGLRGQTSDPAIWAAGDCASFPRDGAQIRLESVQNAIDQAELVACNMLGQGCDYDPKPWFWSDQYDVKLQIAGLNTGYDHVIARAGEKSGTVSHWYYTGDRLIAVDAMNDPRAYMVGKRLIEAGTSPAPERVGDPDVGLMELMRG